ncbi:MAG: hypothetical protein HQL32_16205, partial [Planctomycetes bacterium]|nr:hypothetical protein [Planctomycetota bacterium]
MRQQFDDSSNCVNSSLMPAVLEALLDENYQRLESDECKLKLIEFLRNTDTVKNQHVLFIKKFSKVAHHVLQSDIESLHGLLPKLYQFDI